MRFNTHERPRQNRSVFNFVIGAPIVLFWSIVCIGQPAIASNQPASGSSKTGAFYKDNACTIQLDTRDSTAIKGGMTQVYVLSAQVKDVKFDEQQRHTRFYNDVQSVLSSVIQGKIAKASPRKCQGYSHTYQFDRSTLTITGYDASGKPVGSVVVVAGPNEHAFLGLDLAINNGKTLKYDSSTKSLIPQSSSPQLYLSFDWLAGDILTDPQKLPWYKNFSGKVLFSASSKPLDSFGLGIGYRLGNLPSAFGFQLDALSIFFGHYWTKEDSVSGGRPELNGHYKQAWRFGITYDVGSALKWVKW